MAQNSGANQGGTNKSGDKSTDSRRRNEHETGAGNTEAKPMDPGTGTDGRAPGSMKSRQR
jgi:hypothetical protein